MNGPRKANPDDPRAWIEYAASDLRAAEHTVKTLEPCPYWIVAYHAQQCAEKALKAYLIWKRLPYPHTHDLRLLLDQCQAAGGQAWTELHREVERIGPMGVLARYPSLIRTVTQDEAEWAVAAAGRLLEAVKNEARLNQPD